MTGSFTWSVPFTWAGGIPCALPGSSPTSPFTMPGPVLTIEDVAMIAKAAADPRLIGAWPLPATVVPVVKFHGFGAAPAASALPDRSSTPFEIFAVYWVLAARFADGVNVAIWLAASYTTVPLTGAPPGPATETVKLPLLIVIGSI